MAPSQRTAPPRGPSLGPVQVTFYRRMKMQRVYPVVVRWRQGAAPAPGHTASVRLLLAGAQVVPAELRLDPAKPTDQAAFYVTPLARGWLRAQRLEILFDGRKVQELPLASKAVTQRLALCLLVLTFVVPWLVHSYVVHSPYRYAERLDPATRAKAYDIVSDVGERFEKSLAESLPDMPAVVDEYVPAINEGLKQGRHQVAHAYGQLVNASQTEPYTFYAFLIMLGLTVFAALTHRDVRRRRVGKPIPLETPGDEAEAVELEATA
jgi:hypothetical protein